MKCFKIFFCIITSINFVTLLSFVFFYFAGKFDNLAICLVLFISFLLEILFIYAAVGDSTYYIKKNKIDELTKQYEKTLKTFSNVDSKDKTNMEEKEMRNGRSSSSSEAIQEIFKSYANAMADI